MTLISHKTGPGSLEAYRTRREGPDGEEILIPAHRYSVEPHPGGLPRAAYELLVRAELEAHGFTTQQGAAKREVFIWESFGRKGREAREVMGVSLGKRFKDRTRCLYWHLFTEASVTCGLYFNGQQWGVQMERWYLLARARRQQEHTWLGSSPNLRGALRLAVEGVHAEVELNRRFFGARWELENAQEAAGRLGGDRRLPAFALAGKRFRGLAEALEEYGIRDVESYARPRELPRVPP